MENTNFYTHLNCSFYELNEEKDLTFSSSLDKSSGLQERGHGQIYREGIVANAAMGQIAPNDQNTDLSFNPKKRTIYELDEGRDLTFSSSWDKISGLQERGHGQIYREGIVANAAMGQIAPNDQNTDLSFNPKKRRVLKDHRAMNFPSSPKEIELGMISAQHQLIYDVESLQTLTGQQGVGNNFFSFAREEPKSVNEVQKEIDIAKGLVRENGENIKNLSVNLKNNREVALLAINQNVESFKYIGEELQNDINFVLSCIKNNPEVFSYLSPTLKSDKSFILKAIETNQVEKGKPGYIHNGRVFVFLSCDLKKDIPFILQAIKVNHYVFNHVKNKLKNSEFRLRCMRANKKTFVYLSSAMQENRTMDNYFIPKNIKQIIVSQNSQLNINNFESNMITNVVLYNSFSAFQHALKITNYFNSLQFGVAYSAQGIEIYLKTTLLKLLSNSPFIKTKGFKPFALEAEKESLYYNDQNEYFGKMKSKVCLSSNLYDCTIGESPMFFMQYNAISATLQNTIKKDVENILSAFVMPKHEIINKIEQVYNAYLFRKRELESIQQTKLLHTFVFCDMENNKNIFRFSKSYGHYLTQPDNLESYLLNCNRKKISHRNQDADCPQIRLIKTTPNEDNGVRIFRCYSSDSQKTIHKNLKGDLIKILNIK